MPGLFLSAGLQSLQQLIEAHRRHRNRIQHCKIHFFVTGCAAAGIADQVIRMPKAVRQKDCQRAEETVERLRERLRQLGVDPDV